MTDRCVKVTDPAAIVAAIIQRAGFDPRDMGVIVGGPMPECYVYKRDGSAVLWLIDDDDDGDVRRFRCAI